MMMMMMMMMMRCLGSSLKRRGCLRVLGAPLRVRALAGNNRAVAVANSLMSPLSPPLRRPRVRGGKGQEDDEEGEKRWGPADQARADFALEVRNPQFKELIPGQRFYVSLL
jgi:hypothetical protein